ncbi:MAG: GGDEF domain-containing protein [Proteobacteria bacterium]|nr:GGDEF domain-containing protein [Pseudomonadota bacterium]
MIGLMLLDLDKFKPVNDTYGHPVGDALLKWVSERLSATSRETDTVARLGGDEFALILIDPENREVMCKLAERVIDALSIKVNIMGCDLQISTSIGISYYPNHGNNIDDMVGKADQALYAAKKGGRGIYHFFDPERNYEQSEA